MDSEKLRKRKKWSFITGTIGILGFVFLLSFAGLMKDDYKYYYSSDYQSGVKWLQVLAWGSLILGVIDIIQGFYFAYQAEQQSHEVERVYNPNLTTCPDCRQAVSRSAKMCPHCGRELETSAATPDIHTRIPRSPVPRQSRADDWVCTNCGHRNEALDISCKMCGEYR